MSVWELKVDDFLSLICIPYQEKSYKISVFVKRGNSGDKSNVRTCETKSLCHIKKKIVWKIEMKWAAKYMKIDLLTILFRDDCSATLDTARRISEERLSAPMQNQLHLLRCQQRCDSMVIYGVIVRSGGSNDSF